jgi:UDP-glucose 4-epimerase
MEILITGGAGFIGSHLVDALVANQYDGCGWTKHYDITVIDNLITGKRENIQDKLDAINFIEKDLLKEDEKKKYNLIYHLASDVNARNNDLATYENNIALTKKAISLLEEGGHFIYASSCSVYGDKNHPKETDGYAPLGLYAISKVIGEEIIKNSGIQYNIFRFGNVFGERQDGAADSGIIAIIRECKKKMKPLQLFNKGKTKRDYIYVKDLVSYIRQPALSGIFNLGSGCMIETKKIVKYSRVKYEDGGFAHEPRNVRLNIDKLKSFTGLVKTASVYDFIS